MGDSWVMDREGSEASTGLDLPTEGKVHRHTSHTKAAADTAKETPSTIVDSMAAACTGRHTTMDNIFF